MPRNAITAGVGRSDITPRTGVPLAGFGPYLNRNSTGILAPLQARAIILEASGEQVVLLSLELCALTRELEATIRTVVSRRSKFPANSVFISCTHTHSGPQTGGHIGWGYPDDLYEQTLPQRIWPAVQAALDSREWVTISYASVSCEGIAINREQDAAYDRSQPVDTFLDPDWRPKRPELTDPRCQVLCLHGQAGLKGVIHSFSCHPVVCCEQSTRIHGDFPGLACSQIEQDVRGAVAVFLPGAIGDVNPSVSHREEEESLRALETISLRYAAVVTAGIKKAIPVDEHKLGIRSRQVIAPRVIWSIQEMDTKIEELEKTLNRDGLTDDPLAGGPHHMNRNGMHMVRLMGMRRLRLRMKQGNCVNPPVRLQGLRIGPLLLLGAPFEIYQSTGLAITNALNKSPVMVLSLVNGAEGYAPDTESYERNAYASEFVPLMKGDPPHSCLHELIVDTLTRIGEELLGCPDPNLSASTSQ